MPARIRAAFDVLRGKRYSPVSSGGGRSGSAGWFTLYDSGEHNPGDWQRDIHWHRDEELSYAAVFACLGLIAGDVAKLGLRLMEKQRGVWQETESAAFSPVLRKPNHFQTRQQFIECWLLSKLGPRGNTYVLKQRDQRGVVVAMYVLDPCRVTPLVAPNGEVFYGLNSDDLSGVPYDIEAIPASEIIHDRANCLFHPLVGVSPLFACGLAAIQGIKITRGSAIFFENMSRPSGILTAPGEIDDPVAKSIKDRWEKNYGGGNVGRVAILGNDLKYTPIATTPHDAEIVAQLKLSAEQVCTAFHVPLHKINAGPVPTNNNVEALNTEYYSQCLQTLIEAIEALLDEGLGLWNAAYRSEFDLDDLLRMDSATLVKSLNDAVGGGWLSPNEARAKRGLPPVKGGESPMLQQQNYSLAALAKRDAQPDPFASGKPTPAAQTEPSAPAPAKTMSTSEAEDLAGATIRKAMRVAA